MGSSVRKRSTASVNTRSRGSGVPRFATSDTSVEARIGRGITPLDNGCWHWGTGTIDYPTAKIWGKRTPVHRWIYFTFHPDLNPADWADHHAHHECQNPKCVNPAHIQLLTPREHRQRHGELDAQAS